MSHVELACKAVISHLSFSGGAIIVDNTKALTLAGWKKKREVTAFLRYLPVQATQPTGLPRSPLKKLYIKISDIQFAFYCT